MKPKIVAIVGPTACGKTALGMEMVSRFHGEILSVDSRQVYRDLNIGTAKEISQKGTDLVDPDRPYCVADFKAYAREVIQDIFARGKLPVLVGGTGLWMAAIIDNYDLPHVEPNLELRAELEHEEPHVLFDRLCKSDPSAAAFVDPRNKRRLVRALEVIRTTGRPFSSLRTKGDAEYDVLQIGIRVEREELKRRINRRVDEMVRAGLLEEVKGLRDRYGCGAPAMSGIGYRELCAHLEGACSLEQAIEEIKKNTRQFAKRQMTWFNKDKRIHWVQEAQTAIELVSEHLATS